jgi:hypothetical protein
MNPSLPSLIHFLPLFSITFDCRLSISCCNCQPRNSTQFSSSALKLISWTNSSQLSGVMSHYWFAILTRRIWRKVGVMKFFQKFLITKWTYPLALSLCFYGLICNFSGMQNVDRVLQLCRSYRFRTNTHIRLVTARWRLTVFVCCITGSSESRGIQPVEGGYRKSNIIRSTVS